MPETTCSLLRWCAVAIFSATVALVTVGASAARVERAAAAAQGASQQASVLMSASRCTVSSATPLAAGPVVFTVRNRSGRARRFAIGGRSTAFVAPSRAAMLRVTLGTGRHGFLCAARGRPLAVRRGVVRVSPVPAARILFTSDWSGTQQVYAADPSGRVPRAQLTFGPASLCGSGNPCGFADVAASPDGRRILYSDFVVQGPFLRGLFVADADGRGGRRIATVADFHVAAAWSPDSRRVAYWSGKGIAVVAAGGGSSRLVAATPRVWRLGWSPNGRWLAYCSDGLQLMRADGSGRRELAAGCRSSLSWAPDGRRLAFGDRVVDVETGAATMLRLGHAADEFAWSPNGRLVAYGAAEGVGVADVATGAARVLNSDSLATGSSLAWSPDGRSLAYVRVRGGPRFRFPRPTDLRVVDLLGNARTVVSSAEPFGGTISGVAWTRPPVGVSYRRPEARTLAAVSPEELVAPSTVTRLAADGGRVAYVSCGHVFVWTPADGTVEQAEERASLSPLCGGSYYAGQGVYDLALAGDRVAFGLIGGGNTTFWWLGGSITGQSPTGFTLGDGYATTASPRQNFPADPVGSGSLLVFSSVDQGWAGGRCCDIVPTHQEVRRVGPSGCPCELLATEQGRLEPYDVDGGRVVVGSDEAVLVLDASGTELLRLPGESRSALLAGGDLLVALEGELRRHDASSGALLRTFALPPAYTLEDARAGLAAYLADGRLHVLRLADGTDTILGDASAARFTDAGLVYANGPRLRLVPFGRLETG